MFKRKLVDITILLVFSLMTFVILWIFKPSRMESGNTIETGTETPEVIITEVDKPTVEEPIETEPTEEEVPPEEEEPSEDEVTYWCEWLGVAISREDYELLCRTTYCEAGGESLKAQVMVCLTILNRYRNNKFPSTIRGVVYDKNAYSVTEWSDFENRKWSKKAEQAVQIALAENNHPKNMYYFRTGHYHSWAKKYKKVGKIYFSTHK